MSFAGQPFGGMGLVFSIVYVWAKKNSEQEVNFVFNLAKFKVTANTVSANPHPRFSLHPCLLPFLFPALSSPSAASLLAPRIPPSPVAAAWPECVASCLTATALISRSPPAPGVLPPVGVRRAGHSDGPVPDGAPDGHRGRARIRLLRRHLPGPVLPHAHLDPKVPVRTLHPPLPPRRQELVGAPFVVSMPRRSHGLPGTCCRHGLYGTPPPGATPDRAQTWTGAYQWGGGNRLGGN